MENKDIIFLRKNKAILKIKAIERVTGINNSILVKSVDGVMNLPGKWEKPLADWVTKFISGYNGSDQVPGPKAAPAKPAPAPKPKSAPNTNPPKSDSKPRKEEKEAAEKPDNKARIAELERELKNPPKNPSVGLKVWKKVRENELNKLKA